MMNTKVTDFFRVIAIFVVIYFVLSTAYNIIFLDTWFDEANYAYKSWLTAKGWAQPFVDFNVKYGPVGHYSQSAVQYLFGPSLLAPRIVSALFFSGILVLLYDLLRRSANKWTGLIGVSFLVFHPYVAGKFISAVPYAMIGFFTLLSVWFLFLEKSSRYEKGEENLSGDPIAARHVARMVACASLAAVAAFLIRYNILPIIPLLWIFIYYRWRSMRYVFLSFTVMFDAILLLMIPYFLLDYSYALSFILAMFGPFAKWLPIEYIQLPGSAIQSSFIHTIFNEGRFKLLVNIFTSYFHLWVLGFSGIAFLYTQYKGRFIAAVRKHELFCLTAALFTLLFLPHFVVGPNFHKLYSLYFVHFFSLGAALALFMFYKYMEEKGVWSMVRPVAIPLLVSSIVFAPLSIGIFGNDIIFFSRSDASDADLARTTRAGRYLASLTTEQDVILTLDDPHIVLSAGRYEIPPLINISFTYLDIDDEKSLERFKYYNTNMFLRWMQDTADVVVFQRDALDERLAAIGVVQEKRYEFNRLLAAYFEPIGSLEHAYFRKSERGKGTMEVYRRKEGQNRALEPFEK